MVALYSEFQDARLSGCRRRCFTLQVVELKICCWNWWGDAIRAKFERFDTRPKLLTGLMFR